MNARDHDGLDALKRAGARAAYHLLQAGIESLKAVEAVLDELGRARHDSGDQEESIKQHIDVE